MADWVEKVRERVGQRTKYRLLEFVLLDLAEAKGVTLYAIYAAIKRGKFDPTDIRSVAKHILTKKGEAVCQLCGQKLPKKSRKLGKVSTNPR